MTRELHVYDHASGMIALLFVSPNGAVEAFDVEGFNRIGEFASVAEAAAFACADVEMPRLDSLTVADAPSEVVAWTETVPWQLIKNGTRLKYQVIQSTNRWQFIDPKSR